MKSIATRVAYCIFLTGSVLALQAQEVNVVVHTDSLRARVSPDLHGIFFEEISHGGEGGLYAELIQNRSFEESRTPPGCSIDSGWLIPPRTPHFNTGKISDWKMKWEPKNPWPAWSLQTSGNSAASLAITTDNPLNAETPQSLQVNITRYDKKGNISVVNDGFWGIRVDEGESYHLTFYIRTSGFKGAVQASLQGEGGRVVATHTFADVQTTEWKKYTCTLKATASAGSAKFYLSLGSEGTVWLDFVSLFPAKTFKNRPNGMRVDLANYLADLKPAFVRWPGGCFVEGGSTESAPEWKRSIGLLEKRAGTYSPWGYWSSDGIGYHEFLQFCEDIGADAMYVFNCGVACDMRAGVYRSDEDVPSILANVLDGIEYAIGPATSGWGSVRAKNGHPEPFPLKYVEVGNEQVGERYGNRFNIFYKTIKEKYPQLEVIASMGIAHLSKPTIQAIDKMDLADEHAYKGIYWPMIYPDWYDQYERNDWKLYVGEYACNNGVGSGNMMAALNDATYILGMERNSDLITMSSYAPLLENVNDTDWPVNLIRFNHNSSFARASYYVIKMMNENKASVNLKTTVVPKEANSQPGYPGAVALSTWDTQAEFKDIQVLQNNEVIYTADFVSNLSDWKTEGGEWTVRNGALAQTADGAWPMATLAKKLPEVYTLRLKARKTGGTNAFMIPFAIKDSKNYLRAHIGAWWNRVAAFELVASGTEA
ncbi:MAG TPA: alpha-L-arabinofuranosidase C-terminal domain-containing protein, partial [Cyclobacteriaceae bacterium]|nr:alpha-L-arabinofuranosidase C-terminal domain-containing protein [Cyclobacteriaceae bacterium]